MTGSIAAILTVMALAGPAPSGVPPNITIPAVYRTAVAEMLRYSPTFRRQCSRLARATGLQIEITSSVLPGLAGNDALTRIVRRADGVLEVGVHVGFPGDPITLIPHEFEHILEQLDGVDLPVHAARKASGVRLARDSGHFETDRAIAAGRAVAHEVNRGRTRSGS